MRDRLPPPAAECPIRAGRSARRRAEARDVPRDPTAIDERDLERALIRRSVGGLVRDRHCCADCGRTPLVGETLYRYPGGAAVCELCRPLRGEAAFESERVRHSEHGSTVRVRRA